MNIEFSNIVNFQWLDTNGCLQLRYELFKACHNKRSISLGVWEVVACRFRDKDKTSNSFDFVFCDFITCPDHFDYIVAVTPIEVTEGEVTATVSNGRIAALAQEG